MPNEVKDELEAAEVWVAIATERNRQIEEEGWSAEHDDRHKSGEMLHAAVAYLWHGTDKGTIDGAMPGNWPWDASWWKPKDRRSNLVRAGALCLADRERRLRAHLHPGPADHKLGLVLCELLALRPQREDAGAGGGGWQLAAFDTTIALAKKCGMAREGDVGLDHLIDMRMRVEAAFSAAKLGRWLGWAQAAVVASNCGPTLADMKEINRQQSEQHRVAAPQPSAPEGLREAVARAQETLNNAKVTGENATSQRALEYRLGELINLLAASPSPPTGRDATEEGWQDISTARKDGTVIWALFKADIYPASRPQRDDLERWNGLQVPLTHSGIYERDGRTWDHGWNIAAPVGSGGFPDEWIAGWRPLPAAPKPETAQKGGKS